VVDGVDQLRAQHGHFLAEIGMLRILRGFSRELGLRSRSARVGNRVHAVALGLGDADFRQLRHRYRPCDFLGHGGQGAQAGGRHAAGPVIHPRGGAVRYEPVSKIHISRCASWPVWMRSLIAVGGVDLRRAPRTRTRPCSWHWHWSKLAGAAFSTRASHSWRYPSRRRQLGTGRRAARSGDGREDRGILSGVMRADTLDSTSRLNSNAQPWIVLTEGGTGDK
jgi:hypothetical protein